MISTNNRPSGLRKWLALPVLLAVMALSCSKEQGMDIAKTDNRTLVLTPPQLDKKIAMIVLDSIKVNVAGQKSGRVKLVYLIGTKSGKDTIIPDGKYNLARPKPDEITIEGYKPAGDGKEAEKDPK